MTTRPIPALLLPVLGISVVLSRPPDRQMPPSDEIEGSPMYHVLPKDRIPAVYEPEFVSGEEADAQMLPEEPVLGVFDGVNARAYSLWQLDQHEVVDDVLGGVPIAATW